MRNSSSIEETLKSLFREAEVYILQAAGDCTHRFGPPNYLDKSSNKNCKNIMRFTTFWHRAMFCRAKKKLERGVKVKLDLTYSN